MILGSTIAQNTESVIIASKNTKYEFKTNNTFNALVIRAQKDLMKQLTLKSGITNYQLTIDEHVSIEAEIYQSNVVFFDSPINVLTLNGLLSESTIEIILIRLPKLTNSTKKRLLRTDCEMPSVVSQDIWRTGLPEPNYERIQTEVKNIIIHHSSTSNATTDYYGLVRTIYTSHTQVNGWSDMGYNYLIAPDGTIFAGRDPGLIIAQDEVLGAHFCASNNGTMGICMLGTFMTEAPSDNALSSLNALLAWKTAKDSIAPFGFELHPLNAHLNTIAGHRNGCSTLCPGDALYEKLHPIRETCNHTLENCGVFLSVPEINDAAQALIFPNPSNMDYFQLKLPLIDGAYPNETMLQITNSRGKLILEKVFESSSGLIDMDIKLSSGIYFIHYQSNNRNISSKYIRLP